MNTQTVYYMKKFFTLLLASGMAACLQAKQISESEAAKVAAKLRSSLVATRSLSGAKAKLTKVASEKATLAYVYNYGSNDGFVIVAGDDRAGGVLAYSPSGNFDVSNLAPAAKAWLEGQKNFVAALMGASDFLVPVAPTWDTTVEPLLTSKWGQRDPYNMYCPTFPDSTGAMKNAPTGCVATALAQVMYYYKYPNTGSNVSRTITTSRGETVAVNFGESTYDWSNMTDTYDSLSSEASREAVAKLMIDCGVAVNMNYRLNSSGAVDSGLADALYNVFGFDKGIRMLKGDYYDYTEWCRLFKNELDAKRPILLSGETNGSAGHQFVCDGYDKKGLYHINWGWKGDCDGYFSLYTLDPYEYIKGDSLSGTPYNVNTVAFVGVQPPTEGTVSAKYLVLHSNQSRIIPLTDKIIYSGQVDNYGFEPFVGKINIGIKKDGKTLQKKTLKVFTSEAPLLEGISDEKLADTLDISKFTEYGKYNIFLTAEGDNGVVDTLYRNRSFPQFDFTLDEYGITEPAPSLKVLEANVYCSSEDDPLNAVYGVEAKIKNEGRNSFEGNVVFEYIYGNSLTDDNSFTDNVKAIIPKDSVVTLESSAKLEKGEFGEIIDPILKISENQYYQVFYTCPLPTTPTGIENAKDDDVAISTTEKSIRISGLTPSTVVKVYDMSGRFVAGGFSASSSLNLKVPTSGVYVVSYGKRSRKIVVK